MQGRRSRHLGETLLSQRLITADQLQRALTDQLKSHKPLGEILVNLGFITESKLLKALAAHVGVSFWDFSSETPEQNAVKKLTRETCRLHSVLPVQLRGDLLRVAMRNPHDTETIEMLRHLTRMRIEPVLVSPNRLEEAIEQAYGTRLNSEELQNLVGQALSESGRTRREASGELTEEDTRPVISVVNQILSNAIRTGASDIHLEAGTDEVRVRYRIDGDLKLMMTFPIDILPMLATRLKILAELDIVEHRVPQDGRISATLEGKEIDLRVSIVPNVHGPRIVMRILDRRNAFRTLDELGMASDQLAQFSQMIRRPHGLMLVTGPTGSGKTTSLYAALHAIRSEASNILTCEDPVEYEIEGIGQSSINEKVGLTFPVLLRSLLRQDPDVILVGEIRDQETAETAIRAALTGHLVLSTLHCNDAPSAIARLVDMGADPYLLSTCLIGVTGQRLLRKTCPDCCGRGLQGFPASPCVKCDGDGVLGRVAVHELMAVNETVAEAITRRDPVSVIARLASESGYSPMSDAAKLLVDEGAVLASEAERTLGMVADCPSLLSAVA